MEDLLHLPVPVHPLIYLGSQGGLAADPLPPSLLTDPQSWTPSSVLCSTQRQNLAEGGCSGIRSCGQELEQRQGQATFLERKPPLYRNQCPHLSSCVTDQLTDSCCRNPGVPACLLTL